MLTTRCIDFCLNEKHSFRSLITAIPSSLCKDDLNDNGRPFLRRFSSSRIEISIIVSDICSEYKELKIDFEDNNKDNKEDNKYKIVEKKKSKFSLIDLDFE